jgi:replicative DNA helicase
MVCFIYRPAYYGLTEDESGAPIGDLTEFIVAKHRNGGLDTVNLKFVPELTRFVDYDTPDSFYEPQQSAMNVNNNFDDNGTNSGSYTVGSKMNNDDFSSNNTLDDVPF